MLHMITLGLYGNAKNTKSRLHELNVCLFGGCTVLLYLRPFSGSL